MGPTITPLSEITGATLGARITNIDLSDLSENDWRVVEDAFHEYAALVFPGQNLSADDQVAFAKRFGKIERLREDASMEAVTISNVKPDGTVMQPGEHRFNTLRGNEGWHTDSSYMPLAAKLSMLTAKVVPSSGGETGIADMRAAYDALDDDMKAKVEGLTAHHSLYQSQNRFGHRVAPGTSYGYHTKGAPVRPLVKVHPVTGRKSLFIGRHAFRIDGMPDEEAEAFLAELLAFACQPPRIYMHKWQAGDLMMWDNRCALHRACPYDTSEARVLRHTRVSGEPESELVPTAPDELAGDYQPSSSNW